MIIIDANLLREQHKLLGKAIAGQKINKTRCSELDDLWYFMGDLLNASDPIKTTFINIKITPRISGKFRIHRISK